MTDQIDLSVRKTVTVEAPQAVAFDVFTTQMSAWWPLETHHIGTAPAETAVMEPRAGGRWYEQASDGTTCEWGRVSVDPRTALFCCGRSPRNGCTIQQSPVRSRSATRERPIEHVVPVFNLNVNNEASRYRRSDSGRWTVLSDNFARRHSQMNAEEKKNTFTEHGHLVRFGNLNHCHWRWTPVDLAISSLTTDFLIDSVRSPVLPLHPLNPAATSARPARPMTAVLMLTKQLRDRATRWWSWRRSSTTFIWPR